MVQMCLLSPQHNFWGRFLIFIKVSLCKAKRQITKAPFSCSVLRFGRQVIMSCSVHHGWQFLLQIPVGQSSLVNRPTAQANQITVLPSRMQGIYLSGSNVPQRFFQSHHDISAIDQTNHAWNYYNFTTTTALLQSFNHRAQKDPE